jgi:hypothetical protein
VPVDDVPVRDPLGEQRFAAGEELMGAVLDLGGRGGVQGVAVERAELREGGIPPAE